ncbi:ATP-binding domain-containing protein [Rhizobium gallicum bv. gallicum R602sp]|uniref:ATP-binding domain-containing protein n=1 Tax=Rhizobium gallicum bv. gallicum R602sp TaxID=1041138 RepID=A0A0B4X5A5_9HYPH|nr:ATP-binding protein [Rhizobium gallicum]AJD41687.1 ATP-binding domain-containing protein [Rhizobium gallicum bv. gallicum R602sp]
MNRVLKDGAKVPMFFGQTLIRSLRDQGYSSTTSALCEIIDNSIQWGASNVRVFFRQAGGKGDYNIDVAVLDDGKGMSPNVLKLAMSFGGSLNYEKRTGIGRYGMGMKTAALSMAPSFDVYSWESENDIYRLTLDVDEVGKSRLNMIEMEDPEAVDDLPTEVASILCKPMIWPNRDDQQLVAHTEEEVFEALGNSGTLVYVPDCDRVDARKARTLAERAMKDIGRIYRRFIDNGLKIWVNNKVVESFDPTYWSQNSRHVQIDGLTETKSRLVVAKTVAIERFPGGEKGNLSIRLYELPIEDWSQLPRSVRKNSLRLYDDHNVTILRNDREMFAGVMTEIARRHGDLNWFRVQIDFSGDLDEAMGLSSNKQGVRPKPYVLDEISKAIGNEVGAVRDRIRRFQNTNAAANNRSGVSAAERKANEAEEVQSDRFEVPNPVTEDERAALQIQIRELAASVRREGESEEASIARVEGSTYLTKYTHDPFWPFYHVEYKAARVILTINTAHPFYDRVYKPLSEAAIAATPESEGDEDASAFSGASDVMVGLQLLLFSLARTQSLMGRSDPERTKLFDKMRREWSEAFATQLES